MKNVFPNNPKILKIKKLFFRLKCDTLHDRGTQLIFQLIHSYPV